MPNNEQHERPNVVEINGEKYYNTNELKAYDPVYFFGITKMARKIIEKKQIPESDYLYATFNIEFNKWTVYENNTVPFKAVLYIKKYWVDLNMFKLEQIKDDKSDNSHKLKKKTNTISDPNDNTSDYQRAPNILILNDEEKFRDDKGNIIEIETHGERQYNKIFFLMTDVEKAFDMPNLRSTLTTKKSDYNIKEHYDHFVSVRIDPIHNHTTKVQKNTYITYMGMLKIIYSSRSKKAKTFKSWATNKLFTLQMGTKEQKKELINNVLGIEAKVLSELFDKHNNTVPGIYLFTLGHVQTLRKSMDISDQYKDTDIVAKFGFSNNISRRMDEHNSNYGKIPGVSLKIKFFSHIDPQYISKAEADIKSFMKSIKANFQYKTEQELVILSQEQLPSTEIAYTNIRQKYMKYITDLNSQISDMQKDDERTKKNIELIKENAEQTKRQCENELKIKNLQHNQEIILIESKCENHIQKLKSDLETQKEKYESLKREFDSDVQRKLCEKDLEIQREKHENNLLRKEIELLKLQHKLTHRR